MKLTKKIKYKLETYLAYFYYVLFYFIPIKHLSKTGKFLGENIFSKINIIRKQEVIANIKDIFPDLDANEIYKKSWGVFGATICELTQLTRILKDIDKYVTIVNKSGLDLNNEDNHIFFSAHYGNWEIAALFSQMTKKPSFITYKSPNNPYIEDFIMKLRAQDKENIFFKVIKIDKKSIFKLQTGIKRDNMSLIGYVDQKVKQGIKTYFFNKEVRTLSLLPMLALKNNKKLIPLKVVRKDGFSFDIVLEEPLSVTANLSETEQVAELTQKMNDSIEKWIKEDPSQWFWLHRRW